MQIVDTHAHIYSEDTGKYPLIPEPYLPQPGRGTIEDLKNEAETNNVSLGWLWFRLLRLITTIIG